MLKGHVFKRQIFGNQIFALFVDTFLNGKCGVSNKYGNAMKVTYSGSNVTISDGAVCIRGRFLEEDSSTTISAGTTNSYCSLVIEIDLDKENTSSDFAQGTYKIVKATNSYPSLTQTDIVKNNSGIYQYELARFRTTTSGITNFQDRRTFLDFDSIYNQVESECQSVLQQIKNEYEKTLEGSTYVLKKIELTNENLNDIIEPGFYYGQGTNTVSNKPDGVTSFALLVMRSAGAFKTQVLISSSTNLNNIYIRRLGNTPDEIRDWEELIRENRFAKLEGSFTINRSSSGTTSISYPEGFTMENCVVISCGIYVTAGKGYNFVGQYNDSADGLNSSFTRRLNLRDNDISLVVKNPNTSSMTVKYKIVLMKI